MHNVRRAIFDTDVLRIWERRSHALETIGDGLFLLFARDHAPLAERLDAIAARLESRAAPSRGGADPVDAPQVRLWQQLELETAVQLPGLFDEMTAAGRIAGSGLPNSDASSAPRPPHRRGRPVHDLAGGDRSAAAPTTWAIGRERHDELVDLRAFDGLTADGILEIG